MSRMLLLLVLTLAFVLFVFFASGFSEKADFLTWKWHSNKIYIIFLCLSYDSIKPSLL